MSAEATTASVTEQSDCVRLRQRPSGTIRADDLEISTEPMAEPQDGQLLVKTRYLSLDPYMASAAQLGHLSGSLQPGDVMPAEVVGVALVSRHPDFAAGDIVLTRGGWRAHCVADGSPPPPGVAGVLSAAAHKLAPLPDGVPLSAYLGILGMPGLTAFGAVTRVLRPTLGDTVVVFAAAGGVGATAGQLVRMAGGRAVGVVGSEEKAAYVREELGFDAAVVRSADDFDEQLAAACPDGVDGVLANTTGAAFETVLARMALHGRVTLLGNIEQYNASEPLPGPSLAPLMPARGQITGFVVYDHYDLLPRWQRLAAEWLALGRLVYREDRFAGLASAPEAFARLMRGQTTGKVVVEVGGEPM